MTDNYALGHSQEELKRLSSQAKFLSGLTRDFLVRAGLAPGMHVLDIGCGAGDVSFLAAELVGPSGSVTAVDRAEAAVQGACKRAEEMRLRNVRFLRGTVEDLQFASMFDAVIGRLVLMYQPDPAALLRSAVRRAHRGSIVAFHEFDANRAGSTPEVPTLEASLKWIREALRRTGADVSMGMRLYSTFLEADLPAPELTIHGCVGGGSDFAGYGEVSAVVRTLLPVLEKLGIATADEVGIETLEDRMRAEAVALRATVLYPPFIGAWTRLPD